MSCDDDELDNNPFFRALQTTYLDLYERAQEKCHLICVPLSSSLEGLTINQKFVETHILRTSPYFRGQYLTINSHSRTVLLEEGGGVLQTGEGFSATITVKILNEELAYNKEYKHYKILVIERPLDPIYHMKNSSKGQSNGELYTPRVSLVECKAFLKSFNEYTVVLRSLDDSISRFNKNYMVLKNYLQDAASRLEKMAADAIENCTKCTKHKLYSDPKFREALSGSIESYVLGSVHQKVFPVICEEFAADDQLLSRQCQKLSGVTPEHLGVRAEFSCPLPSAVVELANLDGLTTPRAKQLCLKSAVDNVTEGLNAFVRENQQPNLQGQPSNGDACLTSDDLIPILVTVIAQAKCSHLQSDIYYMENFTWFSTTKDMDNVSYCLVTFKAAVEYMKTTDFSDLKSQHMAPRNEISIDDLMAATNALSVDNGQGREKSRISNNRSPQSASRLDRQLERISKILQDSAGELKTEKKKTGPRSIFGARPEVYQTPDVVPQQDPSRKRQELGEFLSALQDDDFDQPFGKQT
ncbi:ankyrin repeat domain-containing protein 27-like [Haliotis asinina]|uniref:ankyrin repeat domain-containing protein 27-like n=1 Tax=Haliotis asinina TaxID=109174 RepID=UPI003531BEF5